MERPEELRKLAGWYRDWARIANEADQAWRLGFADYLERRAADLERIGAERVAAQ